MMRSLSIVSIILLASPLGAQPQENNAPPVQEGDTTEAAESPPPGKPPSKRDKRAAQKRFGDGEVAFNAGEYMLAARAFEEAWELYPLPAIAFSAAQAYRLHFVAENDASSLKRAVEFYNIYIKEVPSGGRRADAVANLADLEPQLSRMGGGSDRVIDRRTRLLVASRTEGAKIRLGEETAVGSPLTKEVAPGKYRVRVEAPGFFPYDEETEVFEGEFSVLKVDLKAKPALVSIKTNEGATIVVNGEKRGAAPLRKPLELAAGKYIIRSSQSGRKTRKSEIEVGRGEETVVDLELRRTIQRKLAIGVLATSGASFGLALLTGIGAAQRSGDAQDLLDKREMEPWTQDQLERYNDLRDERDTLRLQTYGLLGLGAALGLAGGLMYYLDSPGDSESGAVIAPVATSDGAGVSLTIRH